MRNDVFADDLVTVSNSTQQAGLPSRSSQQPVRLRPLGSGATALLATRAKAGGARRDRTDDLMLAKHALSQLSYGPVNRRRMLSSPPSLFELRRDSLRSSDGSPSRSWRSQRRLVGLGRLELPTSRLSSARSNQLSYKPLTRGAFMACAHPALTAPEAIAQAQPLARVRPRRKRNEDGEIPPMGLNNPEIAGP
jgi:hypothetical protein